MPMPRLAPATTATRPTKGFIADSALFDRRREFQDLRRELRPAAEQAAVRALAALGPLVVRPWRLAPLRSRHHLVQCLAGLAGVMQIRFAAAQDDGGHLDRGELGGIEAGHGCRALGEEG